MTTIPKTSTSNICDHVHAHIQVAYEHTASQTLYFHGKFLPPQVKTVATKEPQRRNPSSDDDLVLGVEASLYGNQGVRTVQEFLRVMDILNLWNDDPEELLLDLGFGCDEPGLSGRIPARFINYQSLARGINLQVFLEAQKSRLDLENPDVSNRFRELEVLQQVTTAFSTLVGSSPSPLSAPQGKDLPPEAREKRRRMGQLFKRVSKKSLSQMHKNNSQDLTTPAAPNSLQYTAGLGDKKVLLKRVKHVPQEIVCLSPLAEEQGPGPDPQALHRVPSFIAQEGAVTRWSQSQGKAFLQRKKSPGQVKESFEIEEAKSNMQMSETVKAPDQDQSPPASLLSMSPENNQEDSPLRGSGGSSLSDRPTNTHKKEDEETTSSLSVQSDLPPPSLNLDSLKICQPACSLPSHDLDFDPVGRISGLTEQSINLTQQDRSFSHEGNTDPSPASPIQDVICVKMDHLSLDSEDTLHMNGKGEVEGERHTDTVQTQEAIVYNSDTESSAGLIEDSRLVPKEVSNQTEENPQVTSCSFQEIANETKPLELRKVCKMESGGRESESARGPLVLPDDVSEAQSRTEVKSKELIENDSLDLVFQTSVDGSESENGDVDAFFQQLHNEGCVYWAEPIQISSSTSVLEESGRFESSDLFPGNSLLSGGHDALDSFSSTDKDTPSSLSSPTTMDTEKNSRNATASSDTTSSLTQASSQSPSAFLDLKQSSSSVSVQMSSSVSSYIVNRKDIPYMTDSKCTPLTSILPLDTSTPFRAVQSWTDLQIQRKSVTKQLSHRALHKVQNKATMCMSASELTQRPTLIFSTSPSLPLLSHDQSHNYLAGMARNDHPMSVSMDKGLWPNEEEKVDQNRNEDEEHLWEGNQTATISCYCSCDHRKKNNKQHTLGNIPYSLDELEEMMLCLQQFCSVLSNMEEQLSEDQAAVYSVLSDQDRENVRDIEELRRAVKQEAEELEMQLNELAHHYDDSLNKNIVRTLARVSGSSDRIRRWSKNKGLSIDFSEGCALLHWQSATQGLPQKIAPVCGIVAPDSTFGKPEPRITFRKPIPKRQSNQKMSTGRQEEKPWKMHKLLGEQSLLCSQLRVFVPGTVPTTMRPAPNRTVATQCCLVPWIPQTDVQTGHASSWSPWNVDFPRQSPPGSENIFKGVSASFCEHTLTGMKDQDMLENFVNGKSEMKDHDAEEVLCTDSQAEDQLKKPRRKDTPVLNSPPHIPGVRLLKTEKQMVHLEDEEKNVKD
ncbi:Coiled-coil domain-containing protein 129 [Collichthys lucidus]|uniref:Coiled-coil domain-containing protein 129 n=1 Tax=Collichthys lucidus TaxID=240159 RepID=A0A4U5VIZ4_COLLU|nr:Coiled-coil domain-containing protein 129 [Collichthys lucidus]